MNLSNKQIANLPFRSQAPQKFGRYPKFLGPNWSSQLQIGLIVFQKCSQYSIKLAAHLETHEDDKKQQKYKTAKITAEELKPDNGQNFEVTEKKTKTSAGTPRTQYQQNNPVNMSLVVTLC